MKKFEFIRLFHTPSSGLRPSSPPVFAGGEGLLLLPQNEMQISELMPQVLFLQSDR